MWMPDVTKNIKQDAGSMLGGTPRGVLHTTETSGVPSYVKGAPHFTVYKGAIIQHIDTQYGARAMQNDFGGVQTNRQGSACVQIEVVAYANNPDWSQADKEAVATIMAWCYDVHRIPLTSYVAVGGGGGCYGENSPCRMSNSVWTSFSGWCGHQNVPENSHWDPGKVNYNNLIALAVERIKMTSAQMQELKDYIDAKGLFWYKNVINAFSDGYISKLVEDDVADAYQKRVNTLNKIQEAVVRGVKEALREGTVDDANPA